MFLENKINIFVAGLLVSLLGGCSGTTAPTGDNNNNTPPVNNADLVAPTKPANIRATMVTPTSVGFSWDASSDNVALAGYRIYKNNVMLAETSATNFLDNSVVANSNYTYSVMAYDAAGNLTASDSLQITTPVVADNISPTAPGNLRSTATTTNSISLAWNASTDNVAITGYRVYRGTILLTTTTSLVYTNSGLSPSTSYQYHVDAIDAAANATSSSVLNVSTTADTTAPSAPANLRTTATTSTTISLAWNASTDNVAVTGYRVYRGTTLLTTTTSLIYTDSGLTASTSYQYHVEAIDAAANATSSSTLIVNTTADSVPDTTAPSAPANLRSTATTSNSISLTWNASTDNVAVTGYRVYRGTSLVTTTTSLGYNLSGLSPSTAYQLHVDAVDAAGNASSSNVITITTSAGAASFPTVLVPVAYNCADSNILCVDDTAGATQEYSTIQAAVNDATAGETVIVHAGTYAGFTVSRSGTSDTNRIIVTANGNNVLINSGSGSDRVLVNNSSFVTIEGFTIEGASNYCLAARGATPDSPMHGVSFQFNTVHNCGSTNIYMSEGADSLILANVSYSSLSSHGIYLANGGSDNTVIKANRCYNNAKNGLHFNGDASVGGDGLHNHITVDSNVFYNNTSNGIDADGVYDSVFTNNLIYGNGGRGIRGFQIDSAAGVKNLAFINNTIVNNAGWGIKLTEDAGGHVFFNNIIMGNGNACIATDNTSLSVNSNIYSTGCNFTVNNEASTMNYATWSSTYSDTSIQSSIATVLNNAAADDYSLATASPAIDAGLASFASVSAPSVDIEGVARPTGSGIDIGAFEH